MASAPVALESPLLTYEAYMTEGEVMQRYDIIDGVRIVTNPTRRHQDILMNIAEALRAFQRSSGAGRVVISPCDVLIRRQPLRTRQPDVLFISHERLAECAPETDPAPLYVGPELVVEILSPSETRRGREQKLADYCSVGVLECWIVSPERQQVEVLRLNTERPQPVATYGAGEEVASITWPKLRAGVHGFFAP